MEESIEDLAGFYAAYNIGMQNAVKAAVIYGARQQARRMYTEEEVITLLEKRDDELDYWYVHKRNNYPHLTDWFEEYKKK